MGDGQFAVLLIMLAFLDAGVWAIEKHLRTKK